MPYPATVRLSVVGTCQPQDRRQIPIVLHTGDQLSLLRFELIVAQESAVSK